MARKKLYHTIPSFIYIFISNHHPYMNFKYSIINFIFELYTEPVDRIVILYPQSQRSSWSYIFYVSFRRL